MTNVTIYSADVTGNPGNCSYPHKHVILDEASLKPQSTVTMSAPNTATATVMATISSAATVCRWTVTTTTLKILRTG